MKRDSENFLRLLEICWANEGYRGMLEEYLALTPYVEALLEQLPQQRREVLEESVCLSRLMGTRAMVLAGEKMAFPDGGRHGRERP